jgi:hypothetical protein
MHEHCAEGDSDKLVRGEKKRHNSAITCLEVGRVISQLTTGGNLNLRGMSVSEGMHSDEYTTDVDLGRTGRWGCGIGRGSRARTPFRRSARHN